jgi:hypothetical protein
VEDDPEYLTIIFNYCVCTNAMASLLDIGRGQWDTCRKAVKTGTVPQHGNSKKRGAAGKIFDNKVGIDLHEFF